MKYKCSHCQLEVDESVMIKDGDKYFCCAGCEGVYHLLSSEGLDTFYAKIKDTTLSPPVQNAKELSTYDIDSFVNKYVIKDGNNHKISLIIEGIHCSACIWLNEKVLHRQDGIIEAHINYTNHKATIIYDSTKLKLSNIIHIIRSIGYNAYPYDPKLQEERASKTRKEYYIKIIVALFFGMNMMMFAIAKYSGYFTGLDSDMQTIFNYTEWFLATPVLFFSGQIFYRGAYYGLKNRMPNMDLLVATGASLVYIYSLYAMISGVGQTYFDSVAMIITFVLVGKFFEVVSKKGVADTLDTINSQIPTEVTVIKDGVKCIVANEEVKVGDIIELKEGEKIVIDGKIIVGNGNFDYSALSGEAMSVYKSVGDTLLSGAINLDCVVRYEATKEFRSSTLNTLTTLIEESLNKKPNIENQANQLSGYFSITIFTIAFSTFLWWYHYADIETAIINAVSVIIIACPCALALATPVATLIGIATTSKRGVIFKETKLIETMANATTLVLDKTGTITIGKPQVVECVLSDDIDMSLLYSLVVSSAHPISEGIAEYIKTHYDVIDKHIEVNVIPSKGLSANVDGTIIYGGSMSYMQDMCIDIDTSADGIYFGIAIDNKLVGHILLKDTPKDGAKETIEYVKSLGIDVIMLTGDNANSAKEIANIVGISEYISDMLPVDKANYIDELHKQNKIVVMVGDGINDSIALSKSDIAIAMGNGTDIAISVSDIVIMNNSLQALKDSFAISHKTYKIIKQNLAISLVYNTLTIPLAMMGYIVPFVSALSMSFSSLLVVANSYRIKR